MRFVPISGEHLHALVVAAGRGEEPARSLLRETLPLLSDLVAAVLVEAGEVAPSAALPAIRDDILGELAACLILRSNLAQWQAAPRERAWQFLETWALGLARRLRDRAWIVRAVDGSDPAARTALSRRLVRLFERAARRRGLTPQDTEDARQSFIVWLLERDCQALRRWDPDGGRSFDSWYFARALNQIDTRRRQLASAPDLVESDMFGASEDAGRLAARQNLASIRAWLEERCNEHQRDIFLRYFIHEESAAEIAAALEMQPAAVYMAVSRLRKALSTLLGV